MSATVFNKPDMELKAERYVQLKRRFPTVTHLRAAARRQLPYFAFKYLDGGAGDDGGIRRNRAALDALNLTPRYGLVTTPNRPQQWYMDTPTVHPSV